MQGQVTGKFHLRFRFFALGPFLSLLDFKHSGGNRSLQPPAERRME